MISAQKKIWLQQEDLLLKKLYEEQGLRNWSIIAKTMALDHNMPKKSAKQCRERYENHINTQTSKIDWSIEEELMLIQYHNEIGNKWSSIAAKIPGKTDNCVKNHFYSKLRKVLRKLNTVIHGHFKRQFREININVIYKIVEACEERFKERPNCQQIISAACRQIQNKMLNISMLKQQLFDSQERIAIYHEIIKQIYAISKMYKRKSKKSRNSAIQAPTLKSKKKKDIIVVSQRNNIEQGYMSESSSAFDDGGNSQQQQFKIKSEYKVSEELKANQLEMKAQKRKDMIIKDEQKGIKELLKDEGLLQYDNADIQSNNCFKFSSKSSFKSYSQKNDSDQQFFEDSDLQKGFYTKMRKSSCFRNIGNPSQKSQDQVELNFYQ